MLGPSAAAAPPAVSISASATEGVAPLNTVLTANGEAASFHWDFGDRSSADGSSVVHDYAGGRFTATLTATSGSGETSTAQVVVTAYGVALSAKKTPLARRYAVRSSVAGRVLPAETGRRVTLIGPGGGSMGQARSKASGAFVIRTRVRLPGTYTLRSDRGASASVPVVVMPRLDTKLAGSGARGSRYELVARLFPAAAGKLDVTVDRGSRRVLERTTGTTARIRLDTRQLWTYRIGVSIVSNAGYTPIVRHLTARVVLPRLSFGARGTAVAQLAAQLRGLHYAAPFSAVFDGELLDAVYAFEK